MREEKQGHAHCKFDEQDAKNGIIFSNTISGASCITCANQLKTRATQDKHKHIEHRKGIRLTW